MFAALAFLKPEHVEDGLIEIHSETPDNAKLSGFSINLSNDCWNMKKFNNFIALNVLPKTTQDSQCLSLIHI